MYRYGLVQGDTGNSEYIRRKPEYIYEHKEFFSIDDFAKIIAEIGKMLKPRLVDANIQYYGDLFWTRLFREEMKNRGFVLVQCDIVLVVDYADRIP